MMSAAVALGAACSSSSPTNETCSGSCDCTSSCESDDTAYVPRDSGSDATLDGSSCPVESYPPLSAACPKTYSISYAGELCGPIGTQCWYPGQGDFGANGCAAAAELQCSPPDSGLGEAPDAAIFDDAGDASVGYWIAAQ